MEVPYLRCKYNYTGKLCQVLPLMILLQHHPQFVSEKQWQNVSDLSEIALGKISKMEGLTTVGIHDK